LFNSSSSGWVRKKMSPESPLRGLARATRRPGSGLRNCRNHRADSMLGLSTPLFR
jgi:hypothetical protein